MQNFSDLVQEEHFKILGEMEEGYKKCVFNGKLTISRKRREIGPRLLFITNRKYYTSFQMI